jgi:glucosamine--fructose-6-phosphate aminotransferase (isomerizing)
MCGIIGFVSQKEKQLLPLLITSLGDLEYRGYDSSGIAIVDHGIFKTTKCLGAPSEHFNKEVIEGEFGTKNITSTVGIGHTRWATHGKPSIQNAHPHFDCGHNIAVVHNGTILNYEILKEQLLALGHIFVSETDSEIIPHLIEQELKGGVTMHDAVKCVAQKLDGGFGLVIINKDDPHKLYVVKNGSPLTIGKTDAMFVVASSPNALLRYTDRYIVLEDGEMGVLDGASLSYEITKYHDKARNYIQKVEQLIDGMTIGDLGKGDYATFMLKEIYEQPSTTRMTMLGRFDLTKGEVILGGLKDMEKQLHAIKHVAIVACGTAYNAGLVAKEIIESLTPVTVTTHVASEFRYSKFNYSKEDTVVIAISQSGETADTLESVKDIQKRGYTTLGIVNVVGSAIANETDAGVFTRAGAEIGVASSKAFTAQCTVAYLLAILLARSRGMAAYDATKFLTAFEKIPDQMAAVLLQASHIQAIAKKYKNASTIQFLGRGVHMAIASEGALKFKELTYKEVGAYSLGELKHGPMAVIDDQSVSIVLLPKDKLFDLSKVSLEQIKSKGGNIIAITDAVTAQDVSLKCANDIITIPHLEDPLLYPLLEVLVLQLFAYYSALQLNRNIDKPRHLAKSVTVQ